MLTQQTPLMRLASQGCNGFIQRSANAPGWECRLQVQVMQMAALTAAWLLSIERASRPCLLGGPDPQAAAQLNQASYLKSVLQTAHGEQQDAMTEGREH